MSKSYGNAIFLSDPEAEVRSKLKTMVTDPARVHRTDPGNPELCPVFDLHRVFSVEQVQNEAALRAVVPRGLDASSARAGWRMEL